MKLTSLATLQKGARITSQGLIFTLALTCLQSESTAQTTPVNLGSASSFGILAGSQISDAGNASVIVRGDVGLFPATGNAIGITEGQVLDGTIYKSETSASFLDGAQNDLTAAYNNAAGRAAGTTFGPVHDMGGDTLPAGVYKAPTSLALTGTLTLDGGGDPNAVWIFQAGTTLISATDSQVSLINGALAANVFWQVGSSATFGTRSGFAGNIMADQSITFNTDATLEGSALARFGAVSLDNNSIAIAVVPEPGTTVLLGVGLATLLASRGRFFSRKSV